MEAGRDPVVAYTADQQARTMILDLAAAQLQPFVCAS